METTSVFWSGKSVSPIFLNDHHGDGKIAANLKLPPGVSRALISSDPVLFFMPAYLGPKGRIGVRLDVPEVNWDQLADLVQQSYRLIAPPTLVSELEGRQSLGKAQEAD